MRTLTPLRWLRRPWLLGLAVFTACLAWHHRPLARDVLLPVVFRDGKMGCINDAGRVAIPGVWDEIGPFDSHGMASVYAREKRGWIDRQGEIVVPCEWDNVANFDVMGMAKVQKDKRWGWIDRTGKVVLPLKWKGACDFGDSGLARVWTDDDFWISRTGKTTPYEEPQPVAEFDAAGMILTQKFGFWGWSDREGKDVLPHVWNFASNFDDAGMAPVCKGDLWGWIDRKGKIVIPIEFQSGYGRREIPRFDAAGMAQVQKGDWRGWIDRKGRSIITSEWDSAYDFYSIGVAVVEKSFLPENDNRIDFKCGFINLAGKIIVPVEWQHSRHVSEAGHGYMVVTRPVEPSRIDTWIAKAKEWLGRPADAVRQPTLCHVYDTTGRLVWSSDDASHLLPLLFAAVAGIVTAVDLLRRWRGRAGRAAVS
jgi:hypothetical protein